MHGNHKHHHHHSDEQLNNNHLYNNNNKINPLISTTIPITIDNPNNDITSKPMLSQKLRILLSALLIVIPSIIRRKITRFDIGAFILVATSFSLLDTAKSFVKEWINKVKSISDSFSRHSTPITKKYFFKNENAADRVTLLGVFVNILLSISKFTGGIVCHSAVLVADAGHSLSDLLSDFITLWAVQVARLPADDDHPYGHGKFESIGSLFLSLTLLFAGLSVGSWSYDKFVHIISALKFKNSFSSAAITASKTFEVLEVPTWPALVLAGISIASKEWLYRITKRVGELLNSQILIANAWHHRSDAFSSVLSLVSIAFTMLLPQYVFVDAIAGILIAGMICFSGLEILFESIKQLTDTSDLILIPQINQIANEINGVLGVKDIKSRSVGNGEVVEMTILTDPKISVSSSFSIAEMVRWKILKKLTQIIEVNVKTRSIDVTCPLLINEHNTSISLVDIDNSIRLVVNNHNDDLIITSIKNVIINYTNSIQLNVEIVVELNKSITSFNEITNYFNLLKSEIKSLNKDIVNVDIYVNINDNISNNNITKILNENV